MLIHSNTLTPTDILSAVPDGCALVAFDHPGFGRTRVGISGSKTHERKFSVRLSGSSPYTMQFTSDTEQAATWDEWGNFIYELFMLDPEAKIGQWGTRENFMRGTAEERDRVAANRPDLVKWHTAPWLMTSDFFAI